MAKREHSVWNRSSDIVVNLLLSDFERIGTRPDNEVLLEKFRDKSVEEVYNILYSQNPKEQKFDLIESDADDKLYNEDIDSLIVQAMGVASKQGNIPASFLEMINEVIRPKMDLETLLHTYMSESFFDKEIDFSHPNRRFIHQNLYLPGYKHERSRLNLFIALDRSMSISKETFSRFLGIIDSIMHMGRDFIVTVVPFDESVDESKVLRYDSQDTKPNISFEKGNGGTLFEPLLDYVSRFYDMQSLLLVLSDGLFKLDRAPEIDTLFLISEKKNMKKLQEWGDVFYFDL